jgi:hypothetical protein
MNIDPSAPRPIAIVQAERDLQVLELVRACLPRILHEGRHGRKFWISAVLDQLGFERESARESIVQLGRSGFFRLTRCDLPQLHSPALVDRSRTLDGWAELHFLEPIPNLWIRQ